MTRLEFIKLISTTLLARFIDKRLSPVVQWSQEEPWRTRALVYPIRAHTAKPVKAKAQGVIEEVSYHVGMGSPRTLNGFGGNVVPEPLASQVRQAAQEAGADFIAHWKGEAWKHIETE